MAEHINKEPWDATPITPELLRDTALSRKPSAAGLDQVTIAMLQALPLSGWAIPVRILNRVEGGERWPCGLLRVSLTAIPKADSASVVLPLKCRLISVLPMLYRVWASARAAQINAEWLPKIMNRHCYGGAPGRSSRNACAMDSLLWDLAHSKGVRFAAAYLDSSRCFDTLKFADLLGLASRVGLGPRVCGALRLFYRDHERFVNVRGWLQTPLKPERGIPQGCPLSILMCILWGLSWSSRTSELTKGFPRSVSGCVCYMDDFSMGSESEECLELCVGWTSEHFKTWQVQLNLEKSAILRNDKALEGNPSAHLATLATKENAKLLGVDTGWKSIGDTLETRVRKALQLVHRVQILRLPQVLFRKVAATYIVPLVFGAEFADCDKQCAAIDNAMWVSTFGQARTAANRGAAMAMTFKSHIATASGKRIMDLFRCIWELAAMPDARPLVLELWHSATLPRQVGLWASWIRCLRSFGLQLTHGGGVRATATGRTVLHVSQDRASWMHAARHLWRSYHLEIAGKKLPDKYPRQSHLVDWHCTLKPVAVRGHMLDTIQANGLNTLDRCRRHFADDCPITCEHGCAEPDTWSHRLLRCHGCRELRDACQLGPHQCALLQDQHRCQHHTLVWLRPEQCLPHVWPIQDAWALWPTQRWLDALMPWLPVIRPDQRIQLNFHYHCHKVGQHPMLQRHNATVQFLPKGLANMEARAVMEAYPMEAWEAETLCLGAIIAVFHKGRVSIGGIRAQPARLWHLIASRRVANPHFCDLCALGKPKVVVQPSVFLGSDHNQEACPDLQIPEDAIQAWNTSLEVAQKAARFCENHGDLLPLAKDFSRHHGFVRGGFGRSGVSFSSGWMGDPLLRFARPALAPSCGDLITESFSLSS